MKKPERLLNRASRKELANALGMSTETLTNKVLAPIGIPPKKVLTMEDLLKLDYYAHPLLLHITRDILSDFYLTDTETFSKKLRTIGIPRGKKLTFSDLEHVYREFGLPPAVDDLTCKLDPDRLDKFYEQYKINRLATWHRIYSPLLEAERMKDPFNRMITQRMKTLPVVDPEIEKLYWQTMGINVR